MSTSDPQETAQAAESVPALRPTLPGHSVDDLRVQGKSAEARAEFERLIQEGMDSGVDPRPPAILFDAIRAEIRNRATPQADGIAGSHG